MSQTTTMKELPETSIWHGAVSDEDVALVRRRHAEKVEEWLDFADFVTELNALHEKYGIEKGEEGYFAYRKHLRTNYYQKLETCGPTPDPLDEGCDCIFCKMHPAESPGDTSVAKSATGRVRCADQRTDIDHCEAGPHSEPYVMAEDSNASQEESKISHNESHATTECNPPIKRRLGRLSADETETCRVRYVDQATPKKHRSKTPPSRPYELIKSGEKTWLKKMSGAVF